MSEERIRQVERKLRFWKRLALVALTVLVLVVLGSASLSGTLYYSLLAEKARFSQYLQAEKEAAERQMREVERVIREAGRRDVVRDFNEAVKGLKLPDQGADKKRD
jgi:hypothetical protein